MGVLIIIMLLVIAWAYRSGRPMKLVLTPEEAKAVKARWWLIARNELKVWAIFFALGYALAADALAREHWHWWIYVLIVWCSLLLFSRLAIWVTVGCIPIFFIAGTVAEAFGHRLPPQFVVPLIIGVPIAIIIRAVFCFLSASACVKESARQQESVKWTPDLPERKYDWNTDSWLYEDGNRKPAHIRFPFYGKSSKDRDLD